MPGLPASYSGDALAAYMRATLGATGAVLALDSLPAFDEAVNDVALALGVTDVADVTDIALLRAHARRAAWQLACDTAAGDYDYSASGESNSRAQVYAHCVQQRDAAASALAALITQANGTATPAWSGSVGVQAVW